MNNDIKEVIGWVILSVLFLSVVGAITWGSTKPKNPVPATQVQGGVIVEKDFCTWFIPKDGNTPVVLKGSRDECYGRDRT